jgi:hypothetical protein
MRQRTMPGSNMPGSNTTTVSMRQGNVMAVTLLVGELSLSTHDLESIYCDFRGSI